ncbi:cytochrome P450 [Phellopilus nigrolimitatus]|nr:cytochrome P450 [Phellopilus nigrolimitatus]
MILSEFTSQVLAAISGVYVLWRVLCFFVVKTPLWNIPGPPRASSWLKGHFFHLFNKDGWVFHRELYTKYGGAVRLNMLFGDEQLYVYDPLALNHILIKEPYVFEETDTFLASFGIVFGTSLLSTLGDEHRKQRKMLNPVFSLKHMRDLLPIFHPIAHKLQTVLEREVSKEREHIDVMKWMSRAALEYIGQGGLGYSFDALNDKETDKYSEAMKTYAPLCFRLRYLFSFLPYIMKLGPSTFRRWVLDLVNSISSPNPVKELTELTDTIEQCSRGILVGKKHALEEGDEVVEKQVGMGKDILSVLLKARAKGEGEGISESDLLGHMSTFILAGHDTSTAAISCALHILSQHPDAQSRLREEVMTARGERGGDDLDYDTLMGLPFLDAVCRETMRVFPPVTQLDRITKKETVLPLAWPLMSSDGEAEISQIPLKKNTTVIISILGANRSKAIWGDDAEEWKPERWVGRSPESVAKARLPGVYSQMMTFLGGGRACIGFKFAEMEMKLVLAALLEKFVFAPGPEIYWEMGQLYQPVIKGSDDRTPRLPLKVTLVGNEH